MEFEFALPAEQAALPGRLKSLAGLRERRARSRGLRVIWHDGPDAPLAKAGLTLVERPGQWRLEQMRPRLAGQPGPMPPSDAAAIWPPATPGPLLAQAPTYAELAAIPGVATLLPAPLMPWAAFDGRMQRLDLQLDGESLDLTVIIGQIRTVAREYPICRVLLSGPTPQALALARLLAEGVALTVPLASLAETALASARGTQPAPRRLGPPVLSDDPSVADGFAHIAAHLTDVILHFAPLVPHSLDDPEPVHQMRVAVRRLRSALRVFGRAIASPSVEEADAGLQALATALGPARDWDVFTAGAGAKVVAHFPAEPALARLLMAAERQRLAGYAALGRFLAAPAFRQLAISLAALSAAREWEGSVEEDRLGVMAMPLTEFAAGVLNRRLKKLLTEGHDIDQRETETLHAIRLRGKRLRYAAEFFAPLFPRKAARRFIRRLSGLQEALGAMNDAAVAAELLRELGSATGERGFAIGVVRGLVAASSGAVREDIADAWKKFRSEEPFW